MSKEEDHEKTCTGEREETDVIGEERRLWRTAKMRQSRFSFFPSLVIFPGFFYFTSSSASRARQDTLRTLVIGTEGVRPKKERRDSFGGPIQKARSLMGLLLITLNPNQLAGLKHYYLII